MNQIDLSGISHVELENISIVIIFIAAMDSGGMALGKMFSSEFIKNPNHSFTEHLDVLKMSGIEAIN